MAFALTIDGKPAPASETFAVIDPATGREFAQCPLATVAQLDQAVAAARAAQGFGFISVGTDIGLLANGGRRLLQMCRG